MEEDFQFRDFERVSEQQQELSQIEYVIKLEIDRLDVDENITDILFNIPRLEYYNPTALVGAAKFFDDDVDRDDLESWLRESRIDVPPVDMVRYIRFYENLNR